MKKKAVVFGAGGFIGGHLCKRLYDEGYEVFGADLKKPEFRSAKDIGVSKFHVMNLCEIANVFQMISEHVPDEVYQLAADMGGAGYIFSGENDLNVMSNSARINLNLATLSAQCSWMEACKIFYSSSACVYPQENQLESDRPITAEHTAYPANPDSEYGWEKLFSERLYFALSRNYKRDVRVCRFHNVFGPFGTYEGGREKAPAAMCRKIAELPKEGGEIEVWGDGNQTRSFLYIDEAIEAVRRFMHSDFQGPLNIGSEEMVSINELVGMVAMISQKDVVVNHIEGPLGVRGRNSDNRLIQEKLGWSPSRPLLAGLRDTYKWIEEVSHAKETKKKRTRSENR